MKNPLRMWPAIVFAALMVAGCGGGGGGGGGTTNGSGNTSTATGLIADSGQTSCYYDATIDGIFNPTAYTCLAPGSAWGPDGQDGYYSISPMSFTDNGDGTIHDNVTGLTWQKCSLGDSGADCLTGTTAALDWTTAQNQCASLGAGWRLPTVMELSQIVNYGRSYSTADATAFPATAPSPYWTSTAHPAYSGYAWYVNFAQGNTWINLQTTTNYARCVRG